MLEGFIQKVQLSIKEIKVVPHMNINVRAHAWHLCKKQVFQRMSMRGSALSLGRYEDGIFVYLNTRKGKSFYFIFY